MDSLYESIVEKSNDGIFVARDSEIIYVNRKLEQMSGYEEAELVGASKTIVVAPEAEAQVKTYHEARLNGESVPDQYEVTFETKSGDLFPVELSVTQIEQNEETAAVVFCRDITDQRNRERELEETKLRFKTLFNKAPDAMAIHDSEGRILDANEQLVDNLGYAREELLSMTLTDYEVGLATEQVRQLWDTMDAEEILKVEGKHERKDGSQFPVAVWVSKIQIQDSTRFLALSRDITARKERERELKRTSDVIEKTQENASIGWWEVDLIEDTLHWSDEVYRIHDLPLGKEMSLESAFEFYHPEDGPVLEEAFEKLMTEGESYDLEVRIFTASDQLRWVRTVGDPKVNDDGDVVGILGIFQDITERKEQEKAATETREGLRKVIDLLPDLLFVKNREGEYLLANQATADAYGLFPEELEGEKEPAVLPNPAEAEGFSEDDRAVIESGEPKQIPEETVTTADGDSMRLQTTKIPFSVPGTDEDAVLGYARDVTDLKTYEQQLETQRDNLQILNQVVRHDIRNNLQLVLTYGELLEEYVNEEGEQYIRHVLDAAQDAVDITTTARDVTEVMLQADVDRHPVQLQPVLEREVANARGNEERALVTIDGDLPSVRIHADSMLESVFRNLLSNAIQHNDKEVPNVTVSATQTDGSVVVKVKDNGPGIPDEYKDNIFDQGNMGLESEGTGLGLYLVKTLVSRYDGEVRVEDNEPEGSIFIVQLPVIE